MTNQKHLAKVTKVVEAHGFTLQSVAGESPSLGPNVTRDIYEWTKDDTDGRLHRVTMWLYSTGGIAIFFRYHQTNKIYAPCQCDNANQLHKALTREGL